MNDYYYNGKTQTLACLLESDVVEFEDRDEYPSQVKCYVVFQDLSENRIHIQEVSDFDEDFLPFTFEDIPMLQESWGMDDLTFARLKKMIVELLVTEL